MPALARPMVKPAVRVVSPAVAQPSTLVPVPQSSVGDTFVSPPVSGVAATGSIPKAATLFVDSQFSILLNTETPSSAFALPSTGIVITQTDTIATPTQPTVTVVEKVPPSSSTSVLVSTSATATTPPIIATSTSSTLSTLSISTTATIVTPLPVSNTSPIPTANPGGGSSNDNGNGKGANGNHTKTGQTGQQMGAKSTNPAESSSAAGNQQAALGGTSSVNPAVIAVPIVLVVLLFLAGGIFFVRRHFIQRRQRKRNTWGAGLYPRAPPANFGATEQSYEQPRMANVASNVVSHYPSPAMAPAPPAVYVSEAASVREPSIISTLPTPTYPTASSPISAVGGFGVGAMVPTGAAARAGVKCSFVPSLPDELSIATGDQIQVLAEYDDGWALCDNGRGEQGMVPLDCLDRGMGSGTPLSVTSFAAARSQRRVSSLAGAGIHG